MSDIDPIATALLVGVIALVVATITIIILVVRLSETKRTKVNAVLQLHELQLDLQAKAQQLYQSWMQKDYESIRMNEREIAQREAVAQLEQWKYQSEVAIRTDAIQRSHSVILGKVTEHLAPYLPDFSFNPKDVRFVGSPIDLVVFDGMDEGDLRQIIFVEIKTGSSAALTKRERRIRDVVSGGNVKWMEMRVPRKILLEATIDPSDSSKGELDREFEGLVDEFKEVAKKVQGDLGENEAGQELIDDLIIHGWDLYKEGMVNYNEWSSALKKSHGEEVEPLIREIWKKFEVNADPTS